MSFDTCFALGYGVIVMRVIARLVYVHFSVVSYITLIDFVDSADSLLVSATPICSKLLRAVTTRTTDWIACSERYRLEIPNDSENT